MKNWLFGSKTFSTLLSFLGLTDTPDSYSSQGGKVVAVKSDETGLEFTRNLILGAPITFTGVNLLLNDTHYVIICTAGGITITLPDAQLSEETVYFIKNLTATPVTIVDTAGRQIDQQASFSLALQYDAIMIVAGNGSWWII